MNAWFRWVRGRYASAIQDSIGSSTVAPSLDVAAWTLTRNGQSVRRLSGFSPAVSSLIHQNRVDPNKVKQLKGSGKDGILLKSDVLLFLGTISQLPPFEKLFDRPKAAQFEDFVRVEHDLDVSLWLGCTQTYYTSALLAKCIAEVLAELREIPLDVQVCSMSSRGLVVQPVDPKVDIGALHRAFNVVQSNPFALKTLNQVNVGQSLVIFDSTRCGSLQFFEPPMQLCFVTVGRARTPASKETIERYELELYGQSVGQTLSEPVRKGSKSVLPLVMKLPKQFAHLVPKIFKLLEGNVQRVGQS